MASWMVHLRIADELLGHSDNIDETAFVMGNIAPDSGVPSEDWTEYHPPKAISHFKSKPDDETYFDIDAYCEKYFNDDNSYAFRIGGDEFAIIIENADYSLNDTVIEKCRQLDEELSKKKGNLPGTTLSIGVAHGEENDTRDTLFKKADKALYKVKNEGKADVNLYK